MLTLNTASIALILISTVGVLMYALTASKTSRIGEIVFFCAFLALVLFWSGAR